MEFRLLPVLVFLSLALVASHAAMSPELYWNSVLPDTPMPKAVKDLLQPDVLESKGATVTVGKGGRKGNAGALPDPSPKPKPFGYTYAATENQLHDNASTAIFFLEKDLRPGKQMNLHFNENSNEATTFLTREVAGSVPFSSDKLPEIFSRFSVKSGSAEAETMQNTIKECEAPGIAGEEKFCATSLESMIDFSTSKLGKSVRAISTEAEQGTGKIQKYTIAAGVRKMAANESVVCHRQEYAYAVFYCHATEDTRAYMVPLEGADGSKAKAAAVCHTDTSAWNPKHLAFQVLKVKPGTVPICHFLPQDHIVWVPKTKTGGD